METIKKNINKSFSNKGINIISINKIFSGMILLLFVSILINHLFSLNWKTTNDVT